MLNAKNPWGSASEGSEPQVARACSEAVLGCTLVAVRVLSRGPQDTGLHQSCPDLRLDCGCKVPSLLFQKKCVQSGLQSSFRKPTGQPTANWLARLSKRAERSSRFGNVTENITV